MASVAMVVLAQEHLSAAHEQNLVLKEEFTLG